MSDDEADNNKNDLADIFGDDNIEDSDNDNDSIFGPSSKKSGGRLNKKSDSSSLSRAEKALADTDDEEEGLKDDSGDDNLSDDSGRGSPGKKKKKGKALQKRKSRDNDASGDRDRKKKRKKKGRLTRSSDRGGDSNNKEDSGNKEGGVGEKKVDDGDEYASDASGSADDDDKDFLASDDEFGDLVKEYDQDNTDFNDERPEQRKKNRAPSSSSASAKKKSNPTIYKKTDNADPMFDEFKKVKPKEMTEQELQDQAQAFVDKMDRARRADEIEARAGRPALKKIEFLEEIAQHFCSVKLRPFLIKLGALKKVQEWIVPKQDTKELPSLTVRTRLYRVILDLPYDADAIKGAKLGPLILFLSKHPRETVDNKRLLNSIVEKWSREMHGKQDSAYVSTASGATDELRHAAALQKISSSSQSGAAKKSNSDSSAELEDIIASRVNQKDEKMRFYDPNYNGYVFTVKPDSMAPTDNVFKESEPKLMALARAKKVNTIKSHKYETVANGRDKL